MGRRSSRRSARRQWRLLCAAFYLLAWPRAAPAGISIPDERRLGKEFALRARAALPLVDDVEVTGYVDRIGQKIVAALGRQPFRYHFFVVRDARLNAFSVPGGYVYVNAGLLTRASNDDELAGVLGHEIAHVNAHHLVRQEESTKLPSDAGLLGSLLAVVQPAAGTAAQLRYQRAFEQEADYLGATYMRQAGYDPRGMLDFFQKLLDAQRLSPDFAPPYLRSHPLTQVRLTNLEAVLHTHQWDRGPRRPTSLELERVQLLAHAGLDPARRLVERYRQGVDAQPRDGGARYLLGLAYLEIGAFDAARQTFLAAQQLGFPNVDRDLGRALLHLQRLAAAQTLLARATRAAPSDPVGHRELARVLEARGDTLGAMREYQSALRLAPDMEDAHYGLGILEGRAGRQGDGFYHLGKAFALRGEFDKALSQFEKAAALLPAGGARARQVRAQIAELNGYLHHHSPVAP